MPYQIRDRRDFYRHISGGKCLFLATDDTGKIDPAYVDLLSDKVKYTDKGGYGILNFRDNRDSRYKRTFRITGRQYINITTIYEFLDISKFVVA